MFSSPIFGSRRSRFGRHVTPLVVATLVGWFGVVAQPLAGKGTWQERSSSSRSSIASCNAPYTKAGRRESSCGRVTAKLAEVKERLDNKDRGHDETSTGR